MTKNLIAYFSHDKENYVDGQIVKLDIGNTKVVANKLRDYIDADIYEIKPLHDYPFNYKDCTEIAKKELNESMRPEIQNDVLNIEQYENIYLGYPNWWGTMPMCVWSFLEKYNLSNKHIYPFCTHEGSGLGRSENDIKRLCPNSIIHEGLAIYGHIVSISDKKIKDWLEE